MDICPLMDILRYSDNIVIANHEKVKKLKNHHHKIIIIIIKKYDI